MIRQDDILLYAMSELPFKKYGCALFDMEYLSVMHGTGIFRRSTFVKDCEKLVDAKIIDKETAILNWDKLCGYLGLHYRLVFEDGTHKLHSMRMLKENELQLLYLYNRSTGYHHLVCADRNDNITYDSLGESVTGEAYQHGKAFIESRRVFRKI